MPSPLWAKIVSAASKRQGHPVTVPEWGVTVYVRRLSVADYLLLADEIESAEKGGAKEQLEALVRLCLFVIVDEAGDRVFNDDDGNVIRNSDLAALKRIQEAVLELNKLTKEKDQEVEASFAGRQG